MIDIKSIGRKAAYIYSENLIGLFSAYILWIFISKVVTPDIIGITSMMLSIVIIFATILEMGVSTGASRFLAKSFSEKRTADTLVLVRGSFIIILPGILISSLMIFFFREWIYTNIEFYLVLSSLPLIGMFVIGGLLRSILVASLQTRSLPKIMLIGSICKVIPTVVLVLFGTGVLGFIVGYLISSIVTIILLSFIIVTMFVSIEKQSTINLFSACKTIFIAGVPAWISNIIGIVGLHLGTIIVFGTVGASQAGSYFIASSIFFAISSIRSSLFDVGFPVVSAMDDQRKRLVWKLIKMSLVITLPISSTVIGYSDDIMNFIGMNYLHGSIALKILMLSVLPGAFTHGLTILVYSYGNYRRVLAIGVGVNLSRILLYFMLVPLFGNSGAAVSLTAGTIIGFVVSLVIAKKIGMSIYWKELGLIFVIPTGISFIIQYFGMNYLLGIPIIVIISVILFFKLHIVSKSEIYEYLEILPDRIGKPLINLINRLYE